MKKIIYFALLILCVGTASLSMNANEIPQISQLEPRKENLQNQIENLTNSLHSINEEYELTNTQKNEFEKEITNLNDEISELEIEIKENDTKITSLKSEIDEQFNLYIQNLNSLKKEIDNKSPSIILEIAKNNEEIKKNLDYIMNAYSLEIEKLDNQKSELMLQKISCENNLIELTEKQNKAEETLNHLSPSKENSEEILSVLQTQFNEISQIIAIEKINEQEITVTSDNLEHQPLSALWPVPSFDEAWITNYYEKGRHYGLDIAANFGEPVLACEDGEVIGVEYASDWGNNVLVKHNDNYTTRYAHLSSFAVNVGDTVKKGDVVGYIGSTGRSTGNHLHFEVYYNGTRLNPLLYLEYGKLNID